MTTATRRPVTILIADDDPEDRMLARTALAATRLDSDVRFVEDGVELLAYLRREGSFANADAPLPGVVLVDLNMPRMNGREAILAIKNDPGLRHIPIVVLATSSEVEDIADSYAAGVSSYITKPDTFDGLIEVMRGFSHYWLQIVQLPRPT